MFGKDKGLHQRVYLEHEVPDIIFVSDGLQPAMLAEEGQTAGEGEDNWKLGPLEEGSGTASYLPSLFPAGYIPFKMLLYCL